MVWMSWARTGLHPTHPYTSKHLLRFGMTGPEHGTRAPSPTFETVRYDWKSRDMFASSFFIVSLWLVSSLGSFGSVSPVRPMESLKVSIPGPLPTTDRPPTGQGLVANVHSPPKTQPFERNQ